MVTSPLKLFGFAALPLTFAACLSVSVAGEGSVGTSTTGGSPTTGGLPAEPYQGSVLFQFAETNEYQELASFYATTPVPFCIDGTLQGSCCYRTATQENAYGGTVTPPFVSAGIVTFQDGASTLASPSFEPGSGYGVSGFSNSPVWSAGDTLKVTASGNPGGIASFSGTVLAPTPPTLTPSLATLSTLSRASDFNLTWNAASEGTVTLEIRALSPTTNYGADGSITCTGSSSGGSLSVPAALLTNFPTGDLASLQLTLANNAPLSVSNANIELTADVVVSGRASIQ